MPGGVRSLWVKAVVAGNGTSPRRQFRTETGRAKTLQPSGENFARGTVVPEPQFLCDRRVDDRALRACVDEEVVQMAAERQTDEGRDGVAPVVLNQRDRDRAQ